MKARMISVRIDAETATAMQELNERHGTPWSEQVRRALRVWLEEQGVLKADRKRAPTRKRS